MEHVQECLLASLAKEHGNIDVRNLSRTLAWVDVPRASTTARAQGIAYAPALVGFRRTGGRYRPLLRGIVVAAEDEAPLRAALSSRRATSPEAKQKRKQDRQRRDAENFAARIILAFPGCPPETARTIAEHATAIGSGRVGRVTTTESDVDSVHAAVVAYIRHNYTSYDDIVVDVGREEARLMVAPQIREMINVWTLI